MGRKKIQATAEGRTCGECAHGSWSDKQTNKDVNGSPFLKICEYSNWATNAQGQHVCLRCTQACDKFNRL